jgi:hypothetical protein
MPYLSHPAAAAGDVPWTIVVLAWRPRPQRRIDFIRLLVARYRLILADAKNLMEETLEAPIEALCCGARSESEAREIATTADALGVEVRVVAGGEGSDGVASVLAAWREAHPRLMATHGPHVWDQLAQVAAAHRLDGTG